MESRFGNLSEQYLGKASLPEGDSRFGPLTEQFFDDPINLTNYSIGERAADVGKGILRIPEHLAGTVGKIMTFAADFGTDEDGLSTNSFLSGKYRPESFIRNKAQGIRPQWAKNLELASRKMLRTHGKKVSKYWTDAANTGIEAPSDKLQAARQQAWYKAPVTRALTAVADSGAPYIAAATTTLITKNPHIGLVMLGTMSAADAYDDMTDKGVDRKVAQNLALLTGAWEAGTEIIPFNAMLGKAGKGLLKKFVKVGTMESLQELIQNMGENYFKNFGYKYDPDDPSSIPDAMKIEWGQLMNGWFESLSAGFIMGGGSALAGGSGDVDIDRTEQAEVEAVRDGQETAALPQMQDPMGEVKQEMEEDTEADLTEPEPEPDPVTKLTSAMEAAVAPRAETIQQRKFEQAKRFGTHQELLSTKEGKAAFYSARSALKGALPQVDFELPQNINTNEEHQLVEQIRNHEAMNALEKDNTFEALQNLLVGKAPAPFQIKLLERAFGKEFAEQASRLERKALTTRQKIFRTIKSVANVPHALLASSDLSGSGRQGSFAGTSHPFMWARMTAAGARSLVSDKYATFVDTQIRTNKYYDSASAAGVKVRDYGGVSANKADRYMTDLLARSPKISKLKGYKRLMAEIASIVPTVVSASERAYVTSLNKFRMDMYAHYARQWEGTGKTSSDYKSLANLLNHATGESNNKFIENNAEVFNAAFFAPRWAVSRFELAGDLAFQTPAVRKMAAKMWVKYLATGISAMSLLALAGFDVEEDPRSSDFGKVKKGNTRYDFWGGNTQIVRFFAQLITGQKKTASGQFKDQDRLATVGRFLESKASPLAGLGIDLLRGETFVGDDVYGENADVMEQIYNRMAPLFIQDTIDAARFQGLSTAIPSAPVAFIGVGVQTYPVRTGQMIRDERNRLAQETYGKAWDDLGPLAQRVIQKFHPELETLERQAAFERSKEKDLKIDLSEQKKAGRRVTKSLPKSVQQEMDSLQVSVGGFSRKISSGWYLNDDRYSYYQDRVSGILSTSLSNAMSKPVWAKLNDTQKQQLIEYIVDGTKKSVRNEIITKAKISDLQSIKGAKK